MRTTQIHFRHKHATSTSPTLSLARLATWSLVIASLDLVTIFVARIASMLGTFPVD
jgi:hypothetical protein